MNCFKAKKPRYILISEISNSENYEKSIKSKDCSGKGRCKLQKKQLILAKLTLTAMFPRLRTAALLYVVILLLTIFAMEVNVYNIGLIPSKFYYSLGTKDFKEFRRVLIESTVLVLAVSLCLTVESLFKGLLSIKLRKNMTDKIHNEYLADNTNNTISAIKDIDNPDHRIVTDVRLLAETLSGVIDKTMAQPFIIIYYSYKIFTELGWIGPVSVYVFFLFSAIINRLLIEPVIKRVVALERKEGDYRYFHAILRKYAENVLLQRGFNVEKGKINATFQETLTRQRSLLHWQFPATFAIQGTSYLGSILTYVVIALPVFNGWYHEQTDSELSSTISKNAFLTMYLINSFSTIFKQITQISLMLGYMIRVGEVLQWIHQNKTNLDSIQNENNYKENNKSYSQDINCEEIRADDDANHIISLRNVTVSLPSERVLISQLSFSIEKNENMLITGTSGCGKTALIKSICRLWPDVTGEIKVCTFFKPPKVIVTPQINFLSCGSIFDQIIYPLRRSEVTFDSQKIVTALERANMEHLLAENSMHKWLTFEFWDILSPGEKQKVFFARIFYHVPLLAILDEATSSMDNRTEHLMYQTCRELGVTFISVGHKSTLVQHHKKFLTIGNNGSWSIEET